MVEKEKSVYQVLDELDIDYQKYTHEPVYTIDQAEEQLPEVDVNHCKNLFLRNNRGDKHYLVVMTGEKSADLKKLAKKIESTRLSFASERRLNKYLGLDKGAVSPFGLINDNENHVEVLLDKDIKDKEQILLHPNVNTASIIINPFDLVRFLDWSGNKHKFIELN